MIPFQYHLFPVTAVCRSDSLSKPAENQLIIMYHASQAKNWEAILRLKQIKFIATGISYYGGDSISKKNYCN